MRSTAYAIKSNDEETNELKGVSKLQGKNTNFEEDYNCMFGGDYQKECDNYLFRSVYHEM